MRIIAVIIMMLFMAFFPADKSTASETEIALSMKAGVAAYKAREFEGAYFYFAHAHELGGVKGTYNLGVLYRLGRGVKRDYAEAARLYKIAVSKNYKFAFFALGKLHEKGLGVRKDYHEAARLYKLAVDQNQVKAMNSLAVLYKKGQGVERNYSKAAYLFKRAVDEGNLNAVYNLARMYHSGKGVDQDFKEAARLFEISAAKKNKNSMYLLATMYDTGQGVMRNPKKAADLVFELMERGHDFTRNEIVKNWKMWNKESRRELQRLLKSNGYYKGPISGSFGPSTIKALKHVGIG